MKLSYTHVAINDIKRLRELIAGDYLARYIIKPDQIIIVKIRHGKEQP